MKAYSMPSAAPWASVAWNGEVYCTVSSFYGDGKAATSADGKAWTARTMPVAPYTSIVWNGSIFCAVGGSSVVATSPDGITWTERAGTTYFRVEDLAWNGSIFFAGDIYGGGYSSTDGITWNTVSIPTKYWAGIAWNGSVFCMIPSTQTVNYVYTSSDGVTWTQRTLPVSQQWENIAVKRGVFCLVPYQAGQTVSLVSSDGITWEQGSIGATYLNVGASNTVFCSFNEIDSTSVVYLSLDGKSWHSRAMPISSSWKSIGSNGSDIVVLSTTHAVIIDDVSMFWTNFRGQTEIINI